MRRRGRADDDVLGVIASTARCRRRRRRRAGRRRARSARGGATRRGADADPPRQQRRRARGRGGGAGRRKSRRRRPPDGAASAREAAGGAAASRRRERASSAASRPRRARATLRRAAAWSSTCAATTTATRRTRASRGKCRFFDEVGSSARRVTRAPARARSAAWTERRRGSETPTPSWRRGSRRRWTPRSGGAPRGARSRARATRARGAAAARLQPRPGRGRRAGGVGHPVRAAPVLAAQFIKKDAAKLKVSDVWAAASAAPGGGLYAKRPRRTRARATSRSALFRRRTAEANIDAICKHGLDPNAAASAARRTAAASTLAENSDISVAYCQGGKKMIVFAVHDGPVGADRSAPTASS